MSRGHYFDSDPAVASETGEHTVQLVLADLTARLHTDRGVFSHDRVDPGTRVLLGADLRPGGGTLVDLGCGYGPIAVTLARRAPGADVWAVDSNARARALCERNAAELGLGTIRVTAPEAVPADLVVDEIWSNPPIRIGKEALHELLSGWLARLAPQGRAVLVVQRHLGADSLAAWIGARGWTVDRVLSRQAYRVLEVRRDVESATH